MMSIKNLPSTAAMSRFATFYSTKFEVCLIIIEIIHNFAANNKQY